MSCCHTTVSGVNGIAADVCGGWAASPSVMMQMSVLWRSQEMSLLPLLIITGDVTVTVGDAADTTAIAIIVIIIGVHKYSDVPTECQVQSLQIVSNIARLLIRMVPPDDAFHQCIQLSIFLLSLWWRLATRVWLASSSSSKILPRNWDEVRFVAEANSIWNARPHTFSLSLALQQEHSHSSSTH